MTDTPGREPEERLPARRPPSEPAPAERFSAPPSAHRFELSPERGAQIVRQSANARWVGFLAVIVVVLFVIVYYFYELGAPLGLSTARLQQETEHQQVVAVERGYNLYKANCARCHGPNGEGGIGPALNDQEKLYLHLNPDYLKNVLDVGGRYVCGNANSIMPVWSDMNGGPLNYRQIEEIIAFIRAPNTQEYEVRDPSLNEPTGEHFRGWVDPNYKPAPGATPYPACWVDAVTGGGGASPVPSGGGSPAPSGGATGETVTVTAENIQFTEATLTAPADKAFSIHFINKDASAPHDVDIRKDGQVLSENQPITGGETTYEVKPLAAGSYEFFCSIHPNMTGTLTVQ